MEDARCHVAPTNTESPHLAGVARFQAPRHPVEGWSEEAPAPTKCVDFFFIYARYTFFIITFTFQLNSSEVLPSAAFWTSHKVMVAGVFPLLPALASFLSRIGCSIAFPLLVYFHRQLALLRFEFVECLRLRGMDLRR